MAASPSVHVKYEGVGKEGELESPAIVETKVEESSQETRSNSTTYKWKGNASNVTYDSLEHWNQMMSIYEFTARWIMGNLMRACMGVDRLRESELFQ